MRFLNVFRRRRPDPLSPEMAELVERAVALRWELVLIPPKGSHRQRLELAGLHRRMQELEISERIRTGTAGTRADPT